MSSKADLKPGMRLRAIEPEDLELLYAIENDDSTWACTAAPAYYSRYTLKQYIASAANDIYADGQVRLVAEAVSDNGSPVSLGLADLTSFDPTHMRAEIGLLLLPEFRRQGFGTSVLQALIAYARHLHIHQLWAVTATDNAAVTALFRRNDFQLTGILPDWFRTTSAYTSANIWQRIIEQRD